MNDNKIIYISIPVGLKLLCELIDIELYESSSVECVNFAIDSIKRKYYDIEHHNVNNDNLTDLLIRLVGYDRLEKYDLNIMKHNFNKYMHLLMTELSNKISYDDFNNLLYVGNIDLTEVQLVVVKQH